MATGEILVSVDDPRADDVRALLERHLAFSRHVSPPEHVHALGVEALLGPGITFFGARWDGVLLGVGALRELDEAHGEIKSMHTAEEARGQGVGRAIVTCLLSVAADRGYRRVSLETGTGEAFAAAHALYARTGFVVCEPFGDYTANPYSRCMTITLTTSSSRSDPSALVAVEQAVDDGA